MLPLEIFQPLEILLLEKYEIGFFRSKCQAKMLGRDVILYAVLKINQRLLRVLKNKNLLKHIKIAIASWRAPSWMLFVKFRFPDDVCLIASSLF